MYTSVLLILALTLQPTETADKECYTGSWTDWGPCKGTTPCLDSRADLKQERSFPKDKALDDEGRVAMNMLRQEKVTQWKAESECQARASCPQLNPRESEGPKPCVNGMADVYPCRNVDLLSLTSIGELGYSVPLPEDKIVMANDLWAWTDPITEDEYVIIGLSGGSSFVRVTDPTKPEVLGFMYTQTKPNLWRDMKVVNNAVYIVSEALKHGMQVYDLTHLRGKTDFSILEPDVWYSEIGHAHNVVANEETGYIYVVGDTGSFPNATSDYPNTCQGGLHMVDVRDPLNPKFVGCFSEDGYTHDAQCVIYRGPDEKYYNQEICFCYNLDTLTLVDVTDKTNPVMVSKQGYNGSAFTHQGWLTEDHTVLVMNDEMDEYNIKTDDDAYTKTYMWDITSLENPVLKHTHRSSEKAIDHNLYILGDFTYQSNYDAGLRILRIDQDNFRLTEVGYFDVWPTGENNITFYGTWSNYPYLKSGTIPVSSREYGLFLVTANVGQMEEDYQNGVGYAEQLRMRDVKWADRGATCPALEEIRQCSEPSC